MMNVCRGALNIGACINICYSNFVSTASNQSIGNLIDVNFSSTCIQLITIRSGMILGRIYVRITQFSSHVYSILGLISAFVDIFDASNNIRYILYTYQFQRLLCHNLFTWNIHNSTRNLSHTNHNLANFHP